ncbi:hypothetical protein CEXT_279191 [Caerostris extrusa]|uniref:Uncharacterized protein n=1 Tax=Caerostris extrusa TaxID=172846 RepID=A0AAV4VDX6_CAEEX|nr:hypothetical protein CEXT_279191 [Caerostris extrusa]
MGGGYGGIGRGLGGVGGMRGGLGGYGGMGGGLGGAGGIGSGMGGGLGGAGGMGSGMGGGLGGAGGMGRAWRRTWRNGRLFCRNSPINKWKKYSLRSLFGESKTESNTGLSSY